MPRRPLGFTFLVLMTAATGIAYGLRAVHAADLPHATVDASTAARLEALGYTEQVVDDPDPRRVGVTHRDPRAYPGINYHCTGQLVRFIDMDGKVVHEMPLDVSTGGDAGCLAKTYRPGLMAIVNSPLLSLSSVRKGGSRWMRDDGFHHDVAVDARGRIYALSRHDAVLERHARQVPVWDQSIVVLDGKGRTERRIDLLPLFGSLVPDARLDAIVEERAKRTPETQERYLRAVDVFHPNTIEIVAWPHDGAAGATAALLALRDLDRIAVVDLERAKVLWDWGAGSLIGPHDPWLLGSGHVLVFDNGAQPLGPAGRTYSRVVEVDPGSGTIVWQYPETPSPQFFSPTRGGAQPLPNGNVLVTESTKGHVFEVTREGTIVWDFWNPDFRSQDGARRTIYRMRRLSMEEFEQLRASR